MRPGGPRSPLQKPQGSVITPLLWANIIIFLLTGMGQATGGTTEMFFQQLKLHPFYVREWEVWRLGTYMFVHGSIPHIFFNMWGLWLFGRVVESRLGPSRFLRLYFICGLVGGLAWLLTNWNAVGEYEIIRNGLQLMVRATPSSLLSRGDIRILQTSGGVVGASGSVFGIMLAAAMTAPNLRIMLLFPPIPMKLKTFVGVYAGIEVVLAWRQAAGHGSRIAHLAHLGGLVGAFFYMRHLGHRGPVEIVRRWMAKWRYRKQRKHFRKVVNESADQGDVSASEIDRILDKIGRQGMASLTAEERETLQEAGQRFKGKS